MKRFPVLILFTIIFLSTFAAGDVYTWVGTDMAWDNPTNWTGGVDYPQFDADKAIFPAGTGDSTPAQHNYPNPQAPGSPQ